MIAFVHLPRTAGTSLAACLRVQLDGRVAFDYDDRPLSDTAEDVARRAIARAAARQSYHEAPDRPAMVYGHFFASKFAGLPGVRLWTVLRDPVERVISHYRYWLAYPDRHNALCVRMIDEQMTLRDFAVQPTMAGVLRHYLDGQRLDDFEFVGFLEDWPRSVAAMEERLGIPLAIGHINAAPGEAAVDAATRRDLAVILADDIALYQDARERAWRR